MVWIVERKDDIYWVKRCMTLEIEGIRQKECAKKTWWDCFKDDMKTLGLSQKDVQFMNNGEENQGGNQLTKIHLEIR